MGTDQPVMVLSLPFQEVFLFLSTSLVHRHVQPLTPGSTESVRGCSSLRNSQAQFPMRRAKARPKEAPGAEKGHSSLQRQWDPSLLSLFPSDAGVLTPCGQGGPEVGSGSVPALRDCLSCLTTGKAQGRKSRSRTEGRILVGQPTGRQTESTLSGDCCCFPLLACLPISATMKGLSAQHPWVREQDRKGSVSKNTMFRPQRKPIISSVFGSLSRSSQHRSGKSHCEI